MRQTQMASRQKVNLSRVKMTIQLLHSRRMRNKGQTLKMEMRVMRRNPKMIKTKNHLREKVNHRSKKKTMMTKIKRVMIKMGAKETLKVRMMMMTMTDGKDIREEMSQEIVS